MFVWTRVLLVSSDVSMGIAAWTWTLLVPPRLSVTRDLRLTSNLCGAVEDDGGHLLGWLEAELELLVLTMMNISVAIISKYHCLISVAKC